MHTGFTHRVTRDKLTQMLQANGHLSIRLEWDPIAFLEDQYGPHNWVSLLDVLCLVGKATMAYASTYREYVDLVWPRVGSDLIATLDQWIISGAHPTKHRGVSSMKACFRRRTATVKVMLIFDRAECLRCGP